MILSKQSATLLLVGAIMSGCGGGSSSTTPAQNTSEIVQDSNESQPNTPSTPGDDAPTPPEDGQNSENSDSSSTTTPSTTTPTSTVSEIPSFTKGLATVQTQNLFAQGGRVAGLGTIVSTDNKEWSVPATVAFLEDDFPFASDLYNDYTLGHQYNSDTQAVSALSSNDIVTIDSDGELITGYIFADNYFELYVNGTKIAKDSVPFTNFNSHLVQFRVKEPFTIAMKLVDWEENLGTGTEDNAGSKFHAGDGGMVAVFKNSSNEVVAKTGSDWKAQTFYTAPLLDTSCLQASGSSRLSSNCQTSGFSDGASLSAAHWEIPSNWSAENYDDSLWPTATTYANAIIGVDNKKSYTNFANIFDDTSNDAQFIWSTNVVLDNLVLVRKTVGSSTSTTTNITQTTQVTSGFHLSSLAIKDKNILPFSYTCDGLNAQGERGGVTPTMTFNNIPDNTQSLALTMHIDKGNDVESIWVLYDIPVNGSSVTLKEDGTVGTLGLSADGKNSYFAPCSHEPIENIYTITAYALSKTLNIASTSASFAAVTTAAKSAALETTTLGLSNVRYNPQETSDLYVPAKVPVSCDEKSAAFSAYNGVSVSCNEAQNSMTITSKTGIPERSQLDGDKVNVGIESWIGRVPLDISTTWTFPMQPTYISNVTSNVNIHHPIGISVDGVPILYYAKEGQSSGEEATVGSNYSDRDTVLLGEIDQCGGHAGNGEDYHYHYAPLCSMDTHDPSKPLAYMFDGIPLYFGTAGGTVNGTTSTNYGAGRYDGLDFRPTAVKKGEKSLDECNAYDINSDGATSGYVYYSTKEAPYTLGCFRGVVDQEAVAFRYPQWSPGDRDIAWSGSQVKLTDDFLTTFENKQWHVVEITPSTGNNKLTTKGDILYRLLEVGETGFQSDTECWSFRYRTDSSNTLGTGDTTEIKCRK